MNTKIIIAAVVGAIAAFLLGWLIWGKLLMGYYEANTVHYEGMMLADADMKLWAIFIANLVSALLYAWLFSRMGINSFMGGFQAGAIIAALTALSMSMMFYSMMNWYSNPTIIVVDALVNAVYGGIVGGVIGLILGKVGKNS